MKSKFIASAITVASIAVLTVACGSNKSTNTNNATNSSKTSQATKKAPSEYYFDGTTANIRDLKIKITGVKFYDGLTENDKKVIAFEYDLTNKTNKDIDVNTGWLAVFNAYQDNKNTDGKLEVASTPTNYNNILKNQDQKIKKNGHLNFVVAYELDNDTQPVVLKATKGFDGKFLGQKSFKIGKFEKQKDSTNTTE